MKQGTEYVFVEPQSAGEPSNVHADGKLTVRCENENGEIFEQAAEFGCAVEGLVVNATPQPEESEAKPDYQWQATLGVSVTVCMLVLTLLLVRRRKMRQCVEDKYEEL